MLAFLVFVSPKGKLKHGFQQPKNDDVSSESSVFTQRRSPVRIRPFSLFFFQSDTLTASVEAFSDARIMARNKHNKDKKLHNSAGEESEEVGAETYPRYDKEEDSLSD